MRTICYGVKLLIIAFIPTEILCVVVLPCMLSLLLGERHRGGTFPDNRSTSLVDDQVILGVQKTHSNVQLGEIRHSRR
ncbi:hypothetical protein PC122_g18898 [Phytophthora cactorum]|nr:hypothetical protein PC122_g18898 [Phytophthora cactorum]